MSKKINSFIIPIITHHSIGRMLDTLYKYTEPGTFDVIVIDQTGGKEAEEIVAGRATLYIKPHRNLGFSKAMNTGIKLAQTEYITLANDDVEFINKRWWQGILDTFASDHHIIAVNPNSPKEGSWGYGYRMDNKYTWEPPTEFVVEPENKESVYPKLPDGSGLFYKEDYTEEDYDFLLNAHPKWQKDTVCDAIAMWMTVFKRSGLEKIGLLDEKFYPGGGEDYDMNCRAYSCGYPEKREVCDPEFHLRMVGTTRSWVWHHWGRSKDAISGIDPTNKLFESRERWNANEQLWGDKFDVWGHSNESDGTKKPLLRLNQPFEDDL